MFRHSLYNLMGLGLPLVAALVAIPLLIDSLGTERFGILTLIWALVSYFGLFDLGLGRALTAQLAACWASGERSRGGRLIVTAMAATAALGVAAGLLLAAGADWSVRQLGGVSNPRETVQAIYWMSVAMPFVIMTSALRGVLEARNAFGLLNAIRLPMGLYTFLAPLAVLYWWYNDLAAIAIALALGRIVAFVAHLESCRRLVPAIGRWYETDRNALRDLLQSGGWITLSTIISPLMVYLDRLVVGLTLSVSAVAYYATPYEIATKLWIVPGALTAVLFPRFARAPVQDMADVEDLFRRSVVALFVLLYPATFALALFADELLSVWLGVDFASRSCRLLQVFAFGILVHGIAHVPFAFLQATGSARTLAKIHLFEFLVFLPILWIAAQVMGLRGAVLAWLLRILADAFVVFHFAAANLRELGSDVCVSGIATLVLIAGVPFFAVFVTSETLRFIAWSVSVAGIYVFCWQMLLTREDRAGLLDSKRYLRG